LLLGDLERVRRQFVEDDQVASCVTEGLGGSIERRLRPFPFCPGEVSAERACPAGNCSTMPSSRVENSCTSSYRSRIPSVPLINWRTATVRPCPGARAQRPTAAVVFPVPGPRYRCVRPSVSLSATPYRRVRPVRRRPPPRRLSRCRSTEPRLPAEGRPRPCRGGAIGAEPEPSERISDGARTAY